MKRRTFTQSMSALALAGTAPLAWSRGASAAWPSRPLRILVGFPAGSTPDNSARALADGLSNVLGQSVIVENKAGASGNIAADLVAKATDDHTLGVVINGNLTSARMLNPALPYDPARDFSLLSQLTSAPLALVAPADLPDGAAFFAAGVQAGDRWNYGSVGAGSVAHLGMELLKSRVPGLKAVHVPYQGNPAVVTALLGGQVQMALMPPGLVLQHVKAGKLRIIGLTTSGRSSLAPEVPPLTDAGVKNFNLEVWTGLVGPAALSKAAQQRLAQVVPQVIRSAPVRERLFQQGWNAVGSSPAGFAQRVAEESATMAAIIKAAGVKIG